MTDIQTQLYEKFNSLGISSREELRDRIEELQIEGINQQIIEGYYAEYRKSIKDTGKISTPTIKIAVLNDTHIPYHNKVMVKNFIQFCEDEQPDQIILNGDMVDFYDLSSFDKNPEREGKLQEELDILKHLLSMLRRKCPTSRIIYVEGNHEDRLRRYLWKKAKSLSSLRALKFEELLSLRQYKVEYIQDSYFVNGFEFTHGEMVRVHSSYSAKAEYEKHHSSGISGHCFDDKTEILTQRGWINGLDLKGSDIVGTMNKSTRKFEWNKINQKFVYDNFNELYHIKNNNVDIAVTGGHGLIGLTRNDKLLEFTAEQYYNNPKEVQFILALNEKIKTLCQDDTMLKLLINIVTDGTIEGNAIRWHLKKERKINHLKELLDLLGYEYTISKGLQEDFKIYLPTEFSKPIIDEYFSNGKILPSFIKDMTGQAEIILNEYSITDGCKNSSANNSYQICSNKEQEIDILQELFAKSGYRTSKLQRKDCFTLTVNTRNTIRVKKEHISKIHYTGKVWCISVDNGTLLIRRNGKVVVTQNTHRMGVYCKTTHNGTFGWWENGCGCELNPEYIKGVPDWQNGFSLIYFDDNAYDVHQIYVNKGHFRVNGIKY